MLKDLFVKVTTYNEKTDEIKELDSAIILNADEELTRWSYARQYPEARVDITELKNN